MAFTQLPFSGPSHAQYHYIHSQNWSSTRPYPSPINPLPPLTNAHKSRTLARLRDKYDQPPTPVPAPHHHIKASLNPTGGDPPHSTVPGQHTPLNSLSLTKIFTWNLNRQSSHDVPIYAYLHGHIYLLHYTEPTALMSIKGSLADKAGYVVYITPLGRTYIRQTTLLTRLITLRSSHAGRLHVFIFGQQRRPHHSHRSIRLSTWSQNSWHLNTHTTRHSSY